MATIYNGRPINMNSKTLLIDNNHLLLTNELLRIVMDRYRFE